MYRDDLKAAEPEQIVIQVKGGKASVGHVRDLRGVIEREQAAMGVLVTLQPPAKPMEIQAASACFYEHKMKRQEYTGVQLHMIKELLDGKAIKRPSNVAALGETFKKAPKVKAKGGDQASPGL